MNSDEKIPQELQTLDKATFDSWFDERYAEKLQEQKDNSKGRLSIIATKGTRAAWAMSEVMDDPTELGNKEKMIAAKDLLDRAGFVKTDKVEVKAVSPLFILPEKDNEQG